jgi:hypothetical protein
VGGVPENHEGRFRQVELQDGFTNRHMADISLTFRDYKGIRLVLLRLIIVAQTDNVIWSFDTNLAAGCGCGRGMALNAALIAPHPRFQAMNGGIDATVGVSAISVCFEQKAVHQANGARCLEHFAFAFQANMPIYFAREILLQDGTDFVASVLLERVADFYIFTGDLDGHENAYSALTEAAYPVTERILLRGSEPHFAIPEEDVTDISPGRLCDKR